MEPDELFEVIEKHGEDGVDFITVHAGVTRGVLERLKKQGRITDIVSRGGAFLTEWMIVNNKENPLYEQFDRLVAIAKKYDMTPEPRRRPAAGQHCRRHRQDPGAGAAHPGRAVRGGAETTASR